MYYSVKQVELTEEIKYIEKYLDSVNNELIDDLCNKSMEILKDGIARKFEDNEKRRIFCEADLRKDVYKRQILAFVLWRMKS